MAAAAEAWGSDGERDIEGREKNIQTHTEQRKNRERTEREQRKRDTGRCSEASVKRMCHPSHHKGRKQDTRLAQQRSRLS